MAKCRCDYCIGYKNRRQEIKHGGVTDEELPYRGKKKDTHRWCKGKVGREHNIVKDIWHQHWTVHQCKNCGKLFWELGYFWNR